MGASIATAQSVVLAGEDCLPLCGRSTLTKTCHAVILAALGSECLIQVGRDQGLPAAAGAREVVYAQTPPAIPAGDPPPASRPGNRGSRESRT